MLVKLNLIITKILGEFFTEVLENLRNEGFLQKPNKD